MEWSGGWLPWASSGAPEGLPCNGHASVSMQPDCCDTQPKELHTGPHARNAVLGAALGDNVPHMHLFTKWTELPSPPP